MKLLRQHGKAIEQRTDGAVKMKFYPGGVMGDDKAVLRKMRVGQLQSGGMRSPDGEFIGGRLDNLALSLTVNDFEAKHRSATFRSMRPTARQDAPRPTARQS